MALPVLASPVLPLLLLLLWPGALSQAHGATEAAPSSAAASPALALPAVRLLKAECSSCHNEEKKKGGLRLTSHEGALKGGEDGPVIMPGLPGDSRLLLLLKPGADPHMPPRKQLAPAQIQMLQDWVRAGAPWDPRGMEDDDAIQPVVLGSLPASYRPVMALALSPDARRLAASRGGELVVHDLSQTNFPIVSRWAAHQDAVQSLVWSQDGQRLISGGFRRVAVWDPATGALLHELTAGLAGRITALQFSGTNGPLAAADSVASQSGQVRLLDPATLAVRGSWKAHSDTLFAFDFSRDGRQLVTAGGDRLIKVWDVASKKEIARLEGHNAQVLAVAFNTNATQVASGGADKQLKVWDVATREKISALGNPLGAINALAWPGDGSTLLAVTDVGGVFTYKNLKAHTGEQSSASGDERKISDTPDAVLALATTPDAKRICAGTHDGSVFIWDENGKRLALLEAPAGAARTPTPPSAASLVPVTPTTPPPATTPPAAAPAGSAAPATVGATASVRPLPAAVISLTSEPATLDLTADLPRQRFVITATLANGFDVDATDLARFSASRPAPFELAGPGEIRALEEGHGVLTAHLGGRRVSLPVTVSLRHTTPESGRAATNGTTNRIPPGPGDDSAPPVSFVRDLLPALSRAGCNAGPCHAKPEGQNGFKLSVFSYDPKADYAEIVKESRGRRVFPASPDESLLLAKPLTRLPHEGGQRFEPGSDLHRMLVRWMEEGMLYSQTNEPALARITLWPKERRYPKGATQRLLVRAYYTDGSVRDVTRLAAFVENDKEVARVDEEGLVHIGTLTGQGVVVARYMGFVADAQILVPADRALDAGQFAGLPRNNFIDALSYPHFQRLGLLPSELCTDAEFLRRAKLDAIGRLPSPEEVRAFLSDATPTAQKRKRLIAGLLDDPAYADYWANKWADLLRPNPDRVGIKSVFLLDQWLRDRFRRNLPYDQFVREILVAEGSNHRDGPAVVYRDRREPPELTTMFSQLFLGTRLECAKCHHHPNEKWGQDDFYRLAAYFGPVKQKGAGLSPPISAGTETFYFAPGGVVKHPVTGEVMKPRPPDGPDRVIPETEDPRRSLADWLTRPENPFFAKAAVNRVWGVFFGRGLVDPVDDFRASNPCVNPPLLAALAEDFARHGYDLKHLIRRILESRIYQLSTVPNESNLSDTKNFSRAYRRRLPAEVLLDAVSDATGVAEVFNALPVGARATQAWSYKIPSHFLDAFGRPNASSDCPCERDLKMSVVQSLHLMNAKGLQGKLADPSGRVRQLAAGPSTSPEIVTEIYLTTLNRFPTPDELATATGAFTLPGATRQTATEDVFWALLNSPEFVFNH